MLFFMMLCWFSLNWFINFFHKNLLQVLLSESIFLQQLLSTLFWGQWCFMKKTLFYPLGFKGISCISVYILGTYFYSSLIMKKAFMAIAAAWSQLLLVTLGPWHVRTSLLQFTLLLEISRKSISVKDSKSKKGLLFVYKMSYIQYVWWFKFCKQTLTTFCKI